MKKKRLLILGVTGSIGTQALECLENIELVGFSYFKNIDLANKIKKQFPYVKVFSPIYEKIQYTNIYEFIDKLNPDLVLNAIAGWDGMLVTKYCVENNFTVALANKESLVIAGDFIMDLAYKNNVKIIPVDSEHTTLYELMKIDPKNIKTIYITASGGKYFNIANSSLENVSFKEAITHPTWQMGERITIDSSTLVNKCYELIEAYHFYPNYDIVAIRHKQSIIHSIVEYKNNSLLFNGSVADMKLAIRLALNDLDKNDCLIKPLSLNNLVLTFEEIDENIHLPIKWFNELKKTHSKTIGPIINIVNEWCFDQFKLGNIKFNEIILIIDKMIHEYKGFTINSFEDLFKLKEIIINNLNN